MIPNLIFVLMIYVFCWWVLPFSLHLFCFRVTVVSYLIIPSFKYSYLRATASSADLRFCYCFFMILWFCDIMNLWIYGRMKLWTFEFVIFWNFDFMDLWIYECMNVWLYDFRGAFCGSCSSSSNSVWERHRSVLWLLQQQQQRQGASQECSVALAAAARASGSVTGVFCGSCSSGNRVRESHRSILWLLQQQQRLWASQECFVAPAAAAIASGSVTGVFCGYFK